MTYREKGGKKGEKGKKKKEKGKGKGGEKGIKDVSFFGSFFHVNFSSADMVQVTATTLLLAWTCSSAAGTGVPSIMDLQSHWVDPNVPVSAAASLGPEQRDVATINNFWVCVPFPHPPPAHRSPL